MRYTISTLSLLALIIANDVVAGENVFGYVCAKEILNCTEDAAMLKVYRENEDVYKVCSSDILSCSNSNSAFLVQRESRNSFYICEGYFPTCNAFNADYFFQRDGENSYYACEGRFPLCNGANGDFYAERDGNDQYYICEGRLPICNFVNHQYIFRENTPIFSTEGILSQADLNMLSDDTLSGELMPPSETTIKPQIHPRRGGESSAPQIISTTSMQSSSPLSNNQESMGKQRYPSIFKRIFLTVRGWFKELHRAFEEYLPF